MPAFTPDDPCEYARQLQDCYRKLITGTQASAIEYLSNGVTRRTEFAKSSLADLKKEIQAANDACAAESGEKPRGRRFAITGGARRGGFW